MATVLTIGHSNRSLEAFLGLLLAHGATGVVDVRTTPRSRWFPHFNDDALAASLAAAGLGYAKMGDALGGRPARPDLYREGVADYAAMAREAAFGQGIDRLLSMPGRPALMCSEGDPATCHRCLLVGRRLKELAVDVEHVVGPGAVVGQGQVEAALLAKTDAGDLFAAADADLDAAYAKAARKNAYKLVSRPAPTWRR